jgi:uncharacterized protein (TIRG00374 family)
MKSRKKIIFNGVFLAVVFALTIYGVFHGDDLSSMMDAIHRADKRWLIPGIALVAFFIWGESIIIWYMMRSSGIQLKKRTCFLFSSVGFFFSCITPSASGGQPMQIYYMKKEKISIPVSTVILMIVTITYKLVLVVIGIGIAIFGRGFLHKYLEGILPVFYLGLALNIFCVTFMTILVFHPLLAKAIMVKGMKLLERLHLVKKKDGRLKKLEDSMDTYRNTAAYLKNNPFVIVKVIGITFIQRMALFAVTWFVYQAFGLHGTGFWEILFLQAVISVSVDMLPLPGGMGISETLFLNIFSPVFGGLLLPGMVLSRGLGYYGELLISAAFTVVAQLTIGKK